ncbi:LytTR family transcriptional regulator DNA-binding domain-containing protein [Cytobacillus spongiae]|jgi:DNA-binding LytR/AlgR family response regulator|uniref:LytTR family DNA-binding domain-containing protein n=1 Tax=Cytobacillus spongiae TaxID=2901381 RepID=UPI001F461115|nr:LytTR family DNA-binding domain-containing protein [Cytobacillus spongiae]UII56781.1 LytTR family transcriptional regulator DNA-binding domain-containing protein [Cytobacillus spongiae]
MRVGLVCRNEIREELINRLKPYGIEIYREADLYMVEEGLHSGFLPCIVFDPNDLNRLGEILKPFAPTSATSKIIGSHNEEFYVIDHEQVLYFEAVDSAVLCHTAKEVYRLKEKLYQLEERLPNERFIKVNRSFIVNIDSVAKIIPWFNRRLLLKFVHSKKEVEVSKSFVGPFKEFLGMR